MTRLEKGQNYLATRVRHGTSNKGPYELVVVADPNGRNEISIFARNIPCGVEEGQQFNVKEILEVRYGKKKDQNMQWKPSVTVEATLEPIGSEFDEMTMDGKEIKWEEMETSKDDPWADIDQLPL